MTIGNNNECQFNRQSISGDQYEVKDWQLHSDISSKLRFNLVESIVQAILPSNSPSSTMLSEQRRASLLEFAHKIEREHFHSSDSKEEYFYLIAKKIQHIRQEFEERRLLRKIDNLNKSVHRLMHHNHHSSKHRHATSLRSAIVANQQQINNHQLINSQLLNNQQLINNQLINSQSSDPTSLQTIGTEFRQQMVKRILHVLCPDQRAIYDKRFLILLKYAQKREAQCFARAKSREDYFLLIAEKTEKILFELNYMRDRRTQQSSTTNESRINQPKTQESSIMKQIFDQAPAIEATNQ